MFSAAPSLCQLLNMWSTEALRYSFTAIAGKSGFPNLLLALWDLGVGILLLSHPITTHLFPEVTNGRGPRVQEVIRQTWVQGSGPVL